MNETSAPSAPGASAGSVSLPSGMDGDLAARARYEREVASLDLNDAEQAADRSGGDVDGLYDRADRHRRLAERLDAGDASALAESESMESASPVE